MRFLYIKERRRGNIKLNMDLLQNHRGGTEARVCQFKY